MRNCAAKVSLDKRRTFIPLLLAEGTVAQGTLDARGFAAPAVEEV
jgi:hypothetical protein